MHLDLYHGDCRAVIRSLVDSGVQVHSVVTDPPYHLESVVRRFGQAGAKGARHNKDGRFTRQSRGFMGKQWDGADEGGTRIAQDPAFWRGVYDILLPGGYVLAFSSARTGHWQAVAMEMAGFIMHPFIGWVYGSGFPKGHSAERALGDAPEAERWRGWYYGTQSRKPAIEPIYVAQKPFSEKNCALNILRHGVGPVNIEGCRVPTEGGRHRQGEPSQDRDYRNSGSTNFAMKPGPRGGDPKGRWPANLIHDGSAEVMALFPEAPGQLARSSTQPDSPETRNVYSRYDHVSVSMEPRSDSGSAARFFESYRYLCDECCDLGWVGGGTPGIDAWQEACPVCAGMSVGASPFEGSPIIYHSKATRLDRAGSKHPTVKPVTLIQSLIRHVTPLGGVVLDPFAGSGTTAEAARREGLDCILIERDHEYVADIERRFAVWTLAHEYLERIAVL